MGNNEIYHGAVEAIYTVIGKLCACVCVCVCVHACVCARAQRSQINRHGKARRRIWGTFCCEPAKLKNRKLCVSDCNTRNSDELVWFISLFLLQ
jgi:hypothetical protein